MEKLGYQLLFADFEVLRAKVLELLRNGLSVSFQQQEKVKEERLFFVKRFDESSEQIKRQETQIKYLKSHLAES